MSKYLFYFCIIFTISFSVTAQEKAAILKGTILYSNNTPASYVTLRLQKSKNQTIADINGNFLFQNLSSIQDTLIISGIGIQTKKVFVSLSKKEQLNIVIKIEFGINLLENVEIIGRAIESYKSDYSFASSKTKSSISEIPQSVSTATKELVEDKMQMHLTDALENIAGVTHFSGYEEYNIRGLHAENARLINGLRTFNTSLTSPLLVNVERVEVIKGPTSVLYGNCDPGGTINLVTKKPLLGNHFTASVGKGSWNASNAQIDATGQLNLSKTLLYRLSTGYEQKESFRNGYFLKSFQVAPSLSFIPNHKLQINIDFSYSNTNSVVDRGQPAMEDDDRLLSTPIQLSMIQPSDYLKESNFSAVLSATYKFNNRLSFNSSLLRYQTNQRLSEHNIEDFITDDSLFLSYNYRHIKSTTNTFTNYFSYIFNQGDWKHQLIGGYDFISNNLSGNEWEGELPEFGANNRIVGTFSLLHPIYQNRNVNQYQQMVDSAVGEDIANGIYTSHGIYIQEHLTYKKWQLIAGLRGEFYQAGTTENPSDGIKKLIPKIGINYAINKNYHLYFNYHNGFDPFEPSSVLQVFNQPYKPVTSNMIETGLKADLFKNKLFASIAFYKININNLSVNANDQTNPNLFIQRGVQQSKGVEIEMQGNILTNLSIFLGYSFNQSEIIKSIKTEDIGRMAENAPKHSSNSWIKYRFINKSLRGLSVALGHTQVGQRFTFDKDIILPGYLILNAAVSYQINHFKLAFNLNNIFNKVYWTSAYNNTNKWPGSPRNSMFKLFYTF